MEQAVFSFRTNCQACGMVADFYAPFASSINDEVLFVVQCEECGAFQVVSFDRQDFNDLFLNGGDNNGSL